MNGDVQLVRKIGEVKAELSGLKVEVAGTNQRLDDIVPTQLKEHGKRITALEAAENKPAGSCPPLLARLRRQVASALLLSLIHISRQSVPCFPSPDWR